MKWIKILTLTPLLGFVSCCFHSLPITSNSSNFHPIAMEEGKPMPHIMEAEAWLRNDTLKMQISYGGGCKDHTFYLVQNGNRIWVQDSTLNDFCKAIKHQEIAFRVDPTRMDSLISVNFRIRK